MKLAQTLIGAAVIAGVTLIASTAHAQWVTYRVTSNYSLPSVPAYTTLPAAPAYVAPVQPVVVRRGLFRRPVVAYAPVVPAVYAAPVPVVAAPTTAYYAPAVTSYYAPAGVVGYAPRRAAHYAPAGVSTYYPPAGVTTSFYAPTPTVVLRPSIVLP